MIPPFQPDGNLPPGIHTSNYTEVLKRFGTNSSRREKLVGLKSAIYRLKIAGCRKLYLDGSFVTSKEFPNDYDCCWDTAYVDSYKLDDIFLIPNPKNRRIQKLIYGGEFFPSTAMERNFKRTFVDFFQTDRETGKAKGIVVIDLGDSL